jgi:hypothetical protein
LPKPSPTFPDWRSHKLDMLSFLIGMAQLEAEEHLRLRGKRSLS